MNQQLTREETVFHQAIGKSSGEERATFLNAACQGDSALRARLELLLKGYFHTRFLEKNEPDGRSPPSPTPAAGEGPENVPITEKPGDRIGRYKLIEQIGEGGWGVVYMAEQEEPVRRLVALKIIKMGMDTRDFIARFEAERQALALMDHPNIARVFDGGATGVGNSEITNRESEIPRGRPYFVMELVRGIRLTHYCDQARLSIPERLNLFIQVCQAVQHAHQKGVIHRDLKPSNILVTVNDSLPIPKVIDFGIAKTTGPKLTDKTLFTGFHAIIGTPAYMSPEQAEMTSLDIDTRSDIYSLGVVLYELLTGKTPFAAEELLQAGIDEMRRTIREKEPARPSTRLRTMLDAERTTTANCRRIESPKLIHVLSGDLDWIVMKCLEKDRTRRYETATTLASDVQRFLSSEPVLARPPTALYRWQKFARKHRVGVAAAAGFVLLLTGAVVVSTTLGLWADRERTAASRAHLEEKAQRLRAEGAEVAAKEKEGLARRAESEARQSADKAKIESAKSAQTAGFLEQMLMGIEPEKARDRDITLLKEILDNASRRVGSNFKEQPEVEAHLRGTIGTAYHRLGLFAEAREHLEKCRELEERLYGSEHAMTLGTMDRLARVYLEQGKAADAESLDLKVLEIRKRVFGEEHVSTLVTMHDLGWVYSNEGKFEKAEALYRQVLAVDKRNKAPEDPSVLSTMNNLASACRDLGKLDEAETLLRQVVEIRIREYGTNAPDTLNSMHNLANVYQARHQYKEAEELYRQTVELKLKVFKPDHPETLKSMNNLGTVLFKLGRLDEAEAIQRRVADARGRVLGPDHVLTYRATYNLANTLEQRGNLAEAEQCYLQMLDYHQRISGADSPNTLRIMEELAEVLGKADKLMESERLVRQVLAIRERDLGSTHAQTQRARRHFLGTAYARGQTLLNQGNYTDTERLYRECVQLARLQVSSTNNDLWVASVNLGFFLADWAWESRDGAEKDSSAKHAMEAEQILRQCLDVQHLPTNTSPKQVFEVKNRRGSSLLVAAVTDTSLLPEARDAKFAESERILLESTAELFRMEGVRQRVKADAAVSLMGLYEATGKPDKVVEWKRKFEELKKPAAPSNKSELQKTVP
ncbi:MAG: eukaryotic-like serine/threonine-protein kinase [Verrucomicrobiota bacterium]|jgi:serine/threonine protein kinase/Tfp pilus assembly protein PilF